jgi:undecaprenyl-diphosphatase
VAALIAAIAAALTAIVCVHYLTNYFKTRTLTPFGIYCLVFGGFMVVFTIVVGPP